MTTLPPTVILPPGLDAHILAELLALWLHFAPRDAFERLLVTRLVQATARLHLSAEREPAEADSLWLRYESAADRLFRQSLRALEKHRAEHPVPIPAPAPVAAAPASAAQSAPAVPPSPPQSAPAAARPSAQPQPIDRGTPSDYQPRSARPAHDHAPPARGAA